MINNFLLIIRRILFLIVIRIINITINYKLLYYKKQPLQTRQNSQKLVQLKFNQQNNKRFDKNLIQALHKRNQKVLPKQFINQIQSMADLKKSAQLLSQKTVQYLKPRQQIKSNKSQIFGPLKKLLQLNKIQLQKQKLFNPLFGAISRIPSQTLSFQQILSIKQSNRFISSQNNLNIFTFCLNDQDIKSTKIYSKSILQRNGFDYKSLIESLKLFKIPVYRDISKFARNNILAIPTKGQNVFDYLQSNQMSIKIDNVRFVDIMNVATGRITPEFIVDSLNLQNKLFTNVNRNHSQVMSYENSQSHLQQIYYAQGTQNISVRFRHPQQEDHQIESYLQMNPDEKQLAKQKIYQNFKNSIQQQLQLRQNLFANYVQDEYSHQRIQLFIKQRFTRLIGNYNDYNYNVERLIRSYKGQKDKTQSIKLKQVLQTFQLKKNYDENIEGLKFKPSNQIKVNKQKIDKKKDSQNDFNFKKNQKRTMRKQLISNVLGIKNQNLHRERFQIKKDQKYQQNIVNAKQKTFMRSKQKVISTNFQKSITSKKRESLLAHKTLKTRQNSMMASQQHNISTSTQFHNKSYFQQQRKSSNKRVNLGQSFCRNKQMPIQRSKQKGLKQRDSVSLKQTHFSLNSSHSYLKNHYGKSISKQKSKIKPISSIRKNHAQSVFVI